MRANRGIRLQGKAGGEPLGQPKQAPTNTALSRDSPVPVKSGSNLGLLPICEARGVMRLANMLNIRFVAFLASLAYRRNARMFYLRTGPRSKVCVLIRCCQKNNGRVTGWQARLFWFWRL